MEIFTNKIIVFPLNPINTQKMLFIISNIKKLYTKDSSKTAKQIAQELKCFQYIIFHEEYCFRAIFPSTRFSQTDNYNYFISTTCQEYIDFFDQNYILQEDFFKNFDTSEWLKNKTKWTIEKIQNSNSVLSKKNLSNHTIKNNEEIWSAYGEIKIDFPCSLFNLIVTIGSSNFMHPIKKVNLLKHMLQIYLIIFQKKINQQ